MSEKPAEVDPRAPLAATIVQALPLHRYFVRLEDGREMTACLSRGCQGRGGSRRYAPGDAVAVELAPHDPTLCRILPDGWNKRATLRSYR